MADGPDEKVFTRTEYRRVIAWPERIVREAPFLARALEPAPARRLLDLGCGSGEHTRHFAEQGWEAVGIDISDRMMEEAGTLEGATESGGSARYELRPGAGAAGLPEAPFGAAISLGNTLAFVNGAGEMRRLLEGVAAALMPGAPFLVQLLNYDRIASRPVRALPVNVRPLPEEEGEGEIVFLRVLNPRPDGDVDFYPITLTLRPGQGPDGAPAVEVRGAKHHLHHGWRWQDLEPAFHAAGFEKLRIFGGMAEVPYDRQESSDLVILARRSG